MNQKGTWHVSKMTFVAVAALVVMSSASHSAEVTADAIKKAIDGVAGDPAKVTAYCAMAKKMDQVGDDDKAAEAASAEIDGYFKTLGPEFEAAWSGAQDAPEDSPQGKAFEDAMTKLDEKCK